MGDQSEETLAPQEQPMQDQTASQELSDEKPTGRHGKHLGKKKNKERLGFIRFIEFLYGFTVVVGIAGLMLMSRDNIVYDFDTVMTFVDISLYGTALWLIAKRMVTARPYLIAINSIDIAFEIVGVFVGYRTMTAALGNAGVSALFVAYFAFAKRPREVFTNTLDKETKRDVEMPTPRQFEYWRNLFMYFAIFSVVGHWMEAGFCMLIRMGLVAGSYDPSNTSLWRDWLYPFPPDGVGFVMCVILLYPLKNWLQKHIHVAIVPLVISFLVNGFVCTMVEFCFGIAVNQQHQLWDYSDMAFNFMGQVCLQNAVGFALISTLITWVIYPYIARNVAKVPKNAMSVAAWIIIFFYLVLQSLYLINIPS